MKRCWVLFVALFAMTSVFTDDVIDHAIVAVAKPEKTVSEVKAPVAPQYDNRIGVGIGRLVYERTKNDAMYLGLDAWSVWIWNRDHHFETLSEIEARIGYNLFYNGRDHFTPLFGAGYIATHRIAFHRGKFAYVTAGFKYSHEFNSVFGLGFNLKGMTGQQLANSAPKKFAWGVDLSIPVIFRFAHYRHWDITLEPGYVFLKSDRAHQGVFFGRGTLAYRF